MESIDANWIKARLTGRHGEKVAIARAMDIDVQKLSKILNGKRQVQANEIPGLLRHFNRELAEPAAKFDTATPVSDIQDSLQTLLASISPGARNLTAYRMSITQLAEGLRTGDILAVDISAQPIDGDLVLATLTDPATGTGRTFVAKAAGDWIFPCDPDERPIRFDDEGRVAVLGVIRGSIRTSAF